MRLWKWVLLAWWVFIPFAHANFLEIKVTKPLPNNPYIVVITYRYKCHEGRFHTRVYDTHPSLKGRRVLLYSRSTCSIFKAFYNHNLLVMQILNEMDIPFQADIPGLLYSIDEENKLEDLDANSYR